MRLSLLLRRPLQEVAGWPEPVLDTYAEFLRREPAPDERIEIAIAQLTALAFNRTLAKGEQAKKLTDFLLFDNAWRAKPSATDAQVFSRLDSLDRKQKD